MGKWVPLIWSSHKYLELQVTFFKYKIMQPNKVTHFTNKEFDVVLVGYIETNETIEFVSSLRPNFYTC